MKQRLLILLISLGTALFNLLSAQNVSQGEFTISTSSEDGANALVKTSDGGYAITGFSYSKRDSNSNVSVTKLDSVFRIQWIRTIGGKRNESGYSIVQSNDKGYAITGVTDSYGDTVNGDVYVIKLDSNATLQWTKTIGGPGVDIGNSIVQTNDKGYIVVGSTNSYGFGNSNMYVIKLDSSGNLQWTKTIGGRISEAAYSIIQAKDGGYTLAGYSQSYSSGFENIYVVKLDSSGNLKWTRTIGGVSSDAGYSIIQTMDGGYALAGTTESFGIGISSVYVVKIDTGGNLQWTKTIGNSSGKDAGYSIKQTKDKGYVVAATTDYYNRGSVEGYLIKLDSSGGLVWTKILGQSPLAEFNCVVQANDGGYAASGSTLGIDYAFITKFDSSGNICDTVSGLKYENSGGIITTKDSGMISSGGSITSSDSGVEYGGGAISTICSSTAISSISLPNDYLLLSPNPCTNTLNISFETPTNVFSIQIMDVTGRALLTYDVPLTTYPVSLNVSSLSSGMYLIRINTNSRMVVKKFIKQ